LSKEEKVKIRDEALMMDTDEDKFEAIKMEEVVL
jgi:hypothetical protein